MTRRPLDLQEKGLVLALAAIALLLVVVGAVRALDDDTAPADRTAGPDDVPPTALPTAIGSGPAEPASGAAAPRTHARDGSILGDGRVLVAYYGTGGTGSLGVLGETGPEEMQRRLERAARPFRALGDVQLVYELIVTVADGSPGPDGSYSHHVPRRVVEQYVAAARRHHALLLLDVQPGRAGFLETAQHWAWALREPHVGLALDPEWRMGPDQVPGRVIGSTSAREVNAVTRWLDDLRADEGQPEKLFVLHQFRPSMIRGLADVVDRPGLAMVQHVDGYGSPRDKLATYRAVARPRSFAMGFKLFYDEDVPLMSAAAVGKIRPRVRFVSFQ